MSANANAAGGGGDIFDNFHKFFVANVDFQTTALQVRGYFARFGNVNHVKLIPHRASDGGEGHRRHGSIGARSTRDMGSSS